jgi:hypothetical protein
LREGTLLLRGGGAPQVTELIWGIRTSECWREVARRHRLMMGANWSEPSPSEAEVRALVSRLDAAQWLARVKRKAGGEGGHQQPQQLEPEGASMEAEREVYSALFALCRAGRAQAALELLRVSKLGMD